MCKSQDRFNVNKDLFNSVTNMGNMSNTFGFFSTFKLSAGRELQACGYKFPKQKRFLIGYLSQELIYVLMWIDVLVISCRNLQLCAGPTFKKWCSYALMECALRSRSSRRDSNQIQAGQFAST
jgi:hypothetical protein